MDAGMIQCSRCAKQTISHARFCPRCGLSTAYVAVGPPDPPVRIPPPVVPWTNSSLPPREMKPEPRSVAAQPKNGTKSKPQPAPKPVAKSGGGGGLFIVLIVCGVMAARAGFFTSKKSSTPLPYGPSYNNYNSLTSPPSYPAPVESSSASRGVYITPSQTGGSYAPPYTAPPQNPPRYLPPAPPLGGRPYGEPGRFNPSTGRYEYDSANRR